MAQINELRITDTAYGISMGWHYEKGDEDKETKKECISGLLLSVLEYYKNQDTVWYE